jgi:hypothetical protein
LKLTLLQQNITLVVATEPGLQLAADNATARSTTSDLQCCSILLQDATMLLELCQTLGVQRWVLTLAVLLVDMAHISPFAQQQPELWLTFCQELRANSDFYFLHGVVDALTLGGSA